MRSFKLSRKTLWVVTILFLLYFPASIIIANNYFRLQREYKVQAETFTRQEKELVSSRKLLLQSREHEALLEDYIRDLKVTQNRKIDNPKKVPIKSEPRKEPSPIVEKASLKEPIDIQDVAITKEGSLVTTGLKLINNYKGAKKIGGFIHILVVADSIDPPQIWTYPREQIQDGLPVDFRKGKYFIMKRFSSIKGHIYLVPEGPPPSTVKVLVYNQAGEIVLERGYEVKDES